MSPRLLAIANEIKKGSIVLDVGTDHAFLPIYLIKNKICKSVIASDISENALKGAESNIKKAKVKNIKLVLSDGLNNIEDNYDTLVISGMGSRSIIKILNNKKLPSNIILSSQSDLYLLRSFMNKIGYKINKEIAVLDNKYYVIINYVKGKESLSKKVLFYGKSNDKDYFKYLYLKQKDIYKKVNFIKKIYMLKSLRVLKNLSK